MVTIVMYLFLIIGGLFGIAILYNILHTYLEAKTIRKLKEGKIEGQTFIKEEKHTNSSGKVTYEYSPYLEYKMNVFFTFEYTILYSKGDYSDIRIQDILFSYSSAVSTLEAAQTIINNYLKEKVKYQKPTTETRILKYP